MNEHRSEIRMPWPDRKLWPNSRVGWKALWNAKKEAKQFAWAVSQGRRDLEIEQYQQFEVIFEAPHAHYFDEDNALAACKAYIDGIAHAVGGDDGNWSYRTRRKEAADKQVIFRPVTPEPVKADEPIRRSTLIYGDERDEFLQDITFVAIPGDEAHKDWFDFCTKWNIEPVSSGRRGWIERLSTYIKDASYIAIYEGAPIALV